MIETKQKGRIPTLSGYPGMACHFFRAAADMGLPGQCHFAGGVNVTA